MTDILETARWTSCLSAHTFGFYSPCECGKGYTEADKQRWIAEWRKLGLSEAAIQASIPDIEYKP